MTLPQPDRIKEGSNAKFGNGMRLFIISNRLPLKVRKVGEKFVYSHSEGGLATGLGSLEIDIERYWIGWPGMYVENDSEKEEIRRYMEKFRFYPVFLSPDLIRKYYEGYSNSIVWPLCHYFFSYVQYDNGYWQAYRTVNELFCRTALQYVRADDLVWVQDYQLMLLPGLLRESCPAVSIGYFHHIPFPAYELFRVLPEKAQVIKGLLGADLVAFHTPDYMRYFMMAAQRVTGIGFRFGEVRLLNRIVHVDAFPMGINFRLFYDASLKLEIQKHISRLVRNFGGYKSILTVDRLDYSKGILHRLKGFELFLEKHPEYREKVSLIMIIVPSRDQVRKYADLKMKIDELIGTINGKYATIDWVPIRYFYRSFSFEELVALYHIAEIALITPLRDGMNLVAKEYVAAKRDRPGVLILSELAGAAGELPEAILINPNNVGEIEEAIVEALEMPEEEQLRKLHRMQRVISCQTVDKWAMDFVGQLQGIRRRNDVLYQKRIGDDVKRKFRMAYQAAYHRLLMLDYDGTLVPFAEQPRQALPTPELYELLAVLAADNKNKVVICSGRDRDTLEGWFGHLSLEIAAEHGAFYKEGKKWRQNIHGELWNDEIIHLLEEIIGKTPGSMLEIKRTALVWHYRNADSWLACVREKQLIDSLKKPCGHLGLQIMRGNKIVEIKSPFCTKGAVVKKLLEKDKFDFMLAVGDDTTDEDMFLALPADAWTVKVGSLSENARYNLYNQSQTLPFLRNLLGH